MKSTITIEYCPKCGWMLRAAYMAQEFLTTFHNELKAVSLVPSEVGGRYTIAVNDTIVFDRATVQHFPEVKALKQVLRDVIAPEKSLGHSDKK